MFLSCFYLSCIYFAFNYKPLVRKRQDQFMKDDFPRINLGYKLQIMKWIYLAILILHAHSLYAVL